MHINNRLWLIDLKKQYPDSFRKSNVLELGSGTFDTKETVVRSFFSKCDYVGVDKVGIEGGNYGVDIVSEAKNTRLRRQYFDTMVCVSMFEHDPEWKKSMSNNLSWLKKGGYMFISFGAEGNRPHDPRPWNFVPYKKFLSYCSENGIYIEDAFFEEERYGRNCPGSFNVVGKKIGELGDITGQVFTVRRNHVNYRLDTWYEFLELVKHKIRDTLKL